MRLFKFLHFNKACPAKPWRSRGFTFIEMVMVITIFTIISGVALFNFGDYSDSISLQNLAQQISLEIVQAQRDAISGRNPTAFEIFSCPTQSNPNAACRPSYGAYFDLFNEKEFKYFADLHNDKLYDSLDNADTIEITRGNFISEFAYFDGTNWNPVTGDLHITFTRPYPDATVFIGNIAYSGARIVVESQRGNKKTIEVSSLGQVSVK
ncbi:hypothetical protein A2824_03625 [Candidatus Nomurabacteria bacterium RIFCSPHIGHO2_01_FULL_42_16]|uniref:General secretion pathway GspH domain-containing protein n=1 Tax=Candidatus Nomurabacteria bacterium RIFCSPHIGHO2_01_FULL_42_16 TaxID=1801743 RepID=A0A1F6VKL4_9BACT|nr:MAG: hypothetical protein A2824_03625 [Candidatus Nomurabacteria bacterium RIFCSPHIGHO2_01_FULL_42_16]